MLDRITAARGHRMSEPPRQRDVRTPPIEIEARAFGLLDADGQRAVCWRAENPTLAVCELGQIFVERITRTGRVFRRRLARTVTGAREQVERAIAAKQVTAADLEESAWGELEFVYRDVRVLVEHRSDAAFDPSAVLQ